MRFIAGLVAICLLLADLPVCRGQTSAADGKSAMDPAGIAAQSGKGNAAEQSGDSISINVKLDSMVVAGPKTDTTSPRLDPPRHLNKKPRHRTAIIIACTVGAIALFFLLTSRIQNPLDGVGGGIH